MLHRLAAALCASLIAMSMLASSVEIARSEEGIASVYGAESGKRRADGRPFHPGEIGCAHRTRRLGSVVRVTVIGTGRSIACPINDRGPFVRGRVLDLSVGAARALGVRGLARVRIE
jgi:rare lipoprotein A